MVSIVNLHPLHRGFVVEPAVSRRAAPCCAKLRSVRATDAGRGGAGAGFQVDVEKSKQVGQHKFLGVRRKAQVEQFQDFTDSKKSSPLVLFYHM